MTSPAPRFRPNGRRVPKRAPALQFGAIRRMTAGGSIPAHPDAVDYLSRLSAWSPFDNDRTGDCAAITWANDRRLITAGLGGAEVYPSQEQVWAVYRTQNPAFDPAGDPAVSGPGSPADNGMDLQTLLEELHSNGGPDGARPVAFAQVDHTNPDELAAAVAIFGNLWLGVLVQAAQQDQFAAGQSWAWVDGSPVEGGHAILGGGYDATSKRAVSWGQEIGLEDAGYLSSALEEAWVVIWPEHLGSVEFLQGVDLAALASAYQQMTGQPLQLAPAPVTPAPVEPAPVDPAPVDPAPVPAPEPTPEPDPAPVEPIPAPVDPAPVDPAPEPDPVPAPVDPAPVDPAPVDPAPVPVDPPVDPSPVQPDPAPVDPPVEPTPDPVVDPAPEPAPVDPAPVDPAPVDPAPVDPAPVDPAPVDPAPVDPAPVDPAPVDPAPVDPAPVDPAPVDPAPVDPAPVDPAPVDPAPVDPAPVDPAPVDPAPVDPAPVDPAPVDPAPVDPAPVDPPVDPAPVDPAPAIDYAAIWTAYPWRAADAFVRSPHHPLVTEHFRGKLLEWAANLPEV